MPHTITLLHHGATRDSEARLRSPCWSRASMYFISPARPAAIHAGKCSSSLASAAGAIPARLNPALAAAFLTRDSRPEIEGDTGTSEEGAEKGTATRQA